MTLDAYLRNILLAPVYDVAVETPLQWAPGLSGRTNNGIWLKREDMQPVFSFKLRGAYNKMVRLTAAQKAGGVIAASAGNHAQGVALAAQKLHVSAIIVMPCTTPAIKVNAVRALGAEVVLMGDAYDEAYVHAHTLSQKHQRTFIHPYDDPDVIAGQGTVAMEILRQHAGPLDAIFVPVGGGGLIAGVAAYVKSLRPEVRVIGVEPQDAPTLFSALAQGAPVTLPQVGLFADGVAVKRIGEAPFAVAKDHVDDVVLVSTDEMCAAIKNIYDDTRCIVEASGALAVAGAKRYIQGRKLQGQQFVAIQSGANMNFDRLRHVAERAAIGERREVLLAATIDELPGSFRKFCQALDNRSITEFNYRFSDPVHAHVFVGLQLGDHGGGRADVLDGLRKRGYSVEDLSDNEMAKLHVRYMVGGRANQVPHELLYRFEFPERPGALQRFLRCMVPTWNISMFHYRNHGAAYGRVLVGMQVPPQESGAFAKFLHELGYLYAEETHNPAYALFLR